MIDYLGMIAYTRRRQRDGQVKVFLRDRDGKKRSWVIADEASADLIPRNRPLTLEISYPARWPAHPSRSDAR